MLGFTPNPPAEVFAEAVVVTRFSARLIDGQYVGTVVTRQPKSDDIVLYSMSLPSAQFRGGVEDFLGHLARSYTSQNRIMH